MVALADQQGRSLEQTHIFALAHVLRRPIVVYGVKVVKNYRGENLGFVNFEGEPCTCRWSTFQFEIHVPLYMYRRKCLWGAR